ncbi:MAG: hypothetical protein U0103_25530 [Candidatus Obscuribacterales bacterium]
MGQFIVNRFVKIEILEQHHSAGEAMMGVVGTLFSVLLGFMIASAMTKYQDAQMCGQMEASNVASVFRIARGMSDIDRPRIRNLCRAYVDDVINSEWPKMQRHEKINHGWRPTNNYGKPFWQPCQRTTGRAICKGHDRFHAIAGERRDKESCWHQRRCQKHYG